MEGLVRLQPLYSNKTPRVRPQTKIYCTKLRVIAWCVPAGKLLAAGV
jgi:hypothetical protein